MSHAVYWIAAIMGISITENELDTNVVIIIIINDINIISMIIIQIDKKWTWYKGMFIG